MTENYNFEWDPQKAHDNRVNHGVTFDEGATIFKDPRALSVFDPDHSEFEERWITMGISEKGRLLVMIHSFREESESAVTIRIISSLSSRKATKHETKTYGR